jgi:16S rRNA (guanine1516-N2)-methyltransferase
VKSKPLGKLSLNGIVLTTPYDPSGQDIAFARDLGEVLGSPYVPREKNTLKNLLQRTGNQAALVASIQGLVLVNEGKRLGFHPSMAWNRLSILEKGKGDRLLDISGVGPGDHVLDCTCGMANDAMVLSWAVGKGGSVTALESSPLLSLIVSYGLKHYQSEKDYIIRAMRMIQVKQENCRDYLRQKKDKTFDYVFFDPMFEQTFSHIKGLDLVRSLADYSHPAKGDILEACRVARKAVILKDRVPGNLLGVLDPPQQDRKRRIWYGIWPQS